MSSNFSRLPQSCLNWDACDKTLNYLPPIIQDGGNLVSLSLSCIVQGNYSCLDNAVARQNKSIQMIEADVTIRSPSTLGRRFQHWLTRPAVLISGNAIPMSDFWPENIKKGKRKKKKRKIPYSRIAPSRHVAIIKLIAGKARVEQSRRPEYVRGATKMKWQKTSTTIRADQTAAEEEKKEKEKNILKKTESPRIKSWPQSDDGFQ